MLIASLAGIAIAVAVWLIVPSTSRQRLMLVHGDDPPGDDAIANFLHRRKRRDPSPNDLLGRALRSLAAELRAGATPHEALARAAGQPSLWPNALAAARFGEAVEVGFASDAKANPDLAQALRQLAACWHVGVTRGSGLAVSVERLSLSLRAQQELQATLRNELAAPRATSRMLAFLPAVGVVMGYLLGADPISWFLGSPIGAVIMIVAIALTVLGTVWTRSIVKRVERGLG